MGRREVGRKAGSKDLIETKNIKKEGTTRHLIWSRKEREGTRRTKSIVRRRKGHMYLNETIRSNRRSNRERNAGQSLIGSRISQQTGSNVYEPLQLRDWRWEWKWTQENEILTLSSVKCLIILLLVPFISYSFPELKHHNQRRERKRRKRNHESNTWYNVNLKRSDNREILPDFFTVMSVSDERSEWSHERTCFMQVKRSLSS